MPPWRGWFDAVQRNARRGDRLDTGQPTLMYCWFNWPPSKVSG
jgi:hypothetical protein